MLKCCPCPNQAKVQSCSRRLIRQRSRFLSQHASPKDVHNVERNEAQFDRYLDGISRKVARSDNHVSLRDLYQQYLNEAGSVLGNIVPYEERPSVTRRADRKIDRHESLVGDGLVLVVHASLQDHSDALLKTTVCSGFVVNASLQRQDQGDTIITCAHTLNEITRYRREEWHDTSEDQSFSFIVTSFGQPRVVTRLLSSMPRSDTVALEVKPLSASDRLRSLPLSPYPVYNGTRLLTHLFGSSEPPSIQHSVARTKFPSEHMNSNDIEQPQDWLGAMAYRRWGPGHMLGYRSYTGVEIEAGVSNVLPHVLTSVLPTPGSSGGPIVNAESGSVIGMTSGRRMDNRIEGERGWGCSAESIFEMFSLPGFIPTNKSKHAYP